MEAFSSAVAVFFVVTLMVVMWAAIIGSVSNTVSIRRRELEHFAEGLEEGRLEQGGGLASFGLGGYRHRVLGKLPSGRDVRISDQGNWITYEVHIPRWTRDLVVTAEAIQEAADGDGSADSQAAAARSALRDLSGLLSFSEVRIVDGWLRVSRASFEYAYTPKSLNAVLERLEAVAALYASRPLEVRVLGGQAVGWTAGGDDVRCPYCHDTLDPAQEDLDACADCHTVHHGECLAEAGGCTVLGCSGRSQGRARA